MTESALAGFQRTDGWKVGVDGSVAIIAVGAGGAIDTNSIRRCDRRFHFRSEGPDVQPHPRRLQDHPDMHRWCLPVGFLLVSFCQRHALDLAAIPGALRMDQAVRAGGSAGKTGGRAVHLRHVRDVGQHDVHAHDACERKTGRFQHMPHVDEGRADLIRNRSMVALAGARINRTHAREEDVVADADAGNMRQVGAARDVEARIPGSIAKRLSFSVIGSRQHGAFDDHLHAIGQARAADGARGRWLGEEAGIDLVHVRRLQHAGEQHIDLHDILQR